MLNFFDKVKIFIATNVVWKIIPTKKLETLRMFEATEDDSSWQLLCGMNLVESHWEKAELFVQAIEEAHHAELFRQLFNSESSLKFIKVQTEKRLLYTKKSDSWKLPIYCLIGEDAAVKRFQNIVDVSKNEGINKTLKKIIADEVGHIHKAKELIKVDGKDQKEVNREMRKILRQRFYESWLRSGRKITDLVVSVILLLIYLFPGGLFAQILRIQGLRNQGLRNQGLRNQGLRGRQVFESKSKNKMREAFTLSGEKV